MKSQRLLLSTFVVATLTAALCVAGVRAPLGADGVPVKAAELPGGAFDVLGIEDLPIGVGAIATDRFGYEGTVTRYATLADAQSGTNPIETVAITDRDLALSIYDGYGFDRNIIMGSWWYTTDENTNIDPNTGQVYPKDHPNGNRLYSGHGNTYGNSGVGFVQLYDGAGITDTGVSMYFDNYDGTYWTDFVLSLSGANADYPNAYARFWVEYQGSGADVVIYHTYNLTLTAGGLEGEEVATGVVEATNHPTSVTGTYTGIFENVSTTYPQNNGFYVFELSLNMDNWAFAQGDAALNGDFDDSYFLAAATTALDAGPFPFDETAPRGITGDGAPGFGNSCWQGPATGKANYHLNYTDLAGGAAVTLEDLFGAGHGLTVGDLQSITFYTKKGASVPANRDWWVTLYTQFEGDGQDSGSWFDSRLHAIPDVGPGYSQSFVYDEWNLWSTGGGASTNQLVFYDNPRGYGGYYATLAALADGPVDWDNDSAPDHDYSGELLQTITIQTDSGWNGFDGLIDGIVVTLQDGRVGAVNLIDGPPVVWVDDDYTSGGTNDGHVWGYDAFDNIQDGIDAVATGGTVNVLAGSYSGFDVDKSLTLSGAGQGSDPSVDAVVSGGVDVSASSVALSGLRILPGGANGVNVSYATISDLSLAQITVEGSTNNGVHIQVAEVTGLEIDGCTFLNNGGVGIRLNTQAKLDGLTLINSLFDGNKRGFYVASDDPALPNPPSISYCRNALIADNTFVNQDAHAIYIEEIRDSVIENNTISGGTRGVQLYKAHIGDDMTNVTIRRNSFLNQSQYGVRLQLYSETWSQGPMLDDIGDINVYENVIDGADVGLLIASDPGVSGLNTVHVNRNSFTNIVSTHLGTFHSAGESYVYDCSANYFGTADPNAVNFASLWGDPLDVPKFDFTPIVNNGTDTDPVTPGFQPDMSELTAHTVDAQSGSTGRINEALGLVSGSTIHVAAGTYNEKLVLDFPVNLVGADGAVLDGTGLGLVAGVKIESGDVTFDNIDVVNFGGNGIIVGYEANPPGDLQNVEITNCVVANIQPGSSHGFGIYAGYQSEGFGDGDLTAHLDYSGLVISGNEIYNTANAALVLQSITASIGTLVVSDNHIHDAGASGLWIDTARNITVTGTQCIGNSNGVFMGAIADGWYVEDGMYGPKDISFDGCSFMDNSGYGAVLYAGWPTTISIHNSTIANNGNVGVQNFLTGVVDAEYNFWGDISGPYDPTGIVNVDGYTNCQALAIDDLNDDGLGDGVSDNNVDYCPWTLGPRLTFEPEKDCYEIGETVVVEIWMRDVAEDIVGGQFFLRYDAGALILPSADPSAIVPGDAPMTRQVFECSVAENTGGDCTPTAGEIKYAVAVPDPVDPNAPKPSVTGDHKLAVITFTAGADICDFSGLITWWAHFPPTQLTATPFAAVRPPLQALITTDTTPPVLTGCPADTTVECDTVPVPAVVTATDNCDENVDVTFDEVTTAGTCDDSYTLTRTWTATDHCGNVASCTQVITVEDTTPPVLVGCPLDVTVECDSVPPMAVVTATDNCDPAPVVTPDEVRTDGVCPNSYTLTRTWTATDRCGNVASCTQVITVEDTTPPTVVAPVDVELECSSELPPAAATIAEFVALTGADASDNCSAQGDLTVTSMTDSLVGDECSGTITRTYTIADECGNATSVDHVFNVSDDTAPTITTQPTDATVECDGTGVAAQIAGWLASNGGAAATDNCGTIMWSHDFDALNFVPDCGGAGYVDVVFTATDDCGNYTDTNAARFTIVDTTAPTITCPGDAGPFNATADTCEYEYTWSPATASDACEGDLSALVEYDIDLGNDGSVDDTIVGTTYVFPVGVSKVTAKVADACGNASDCSFFVEVLGYSEVQVTVELEGDFAPAAAFTRCITFKFAGPLCGTVAIERDVDFVKVGTLAVGTAVFTGADGIPCTSDGYTCAMAQDSYHTLQRAITPVISGGGAYVLEFTEVTGKHLVQGDYYDDITLDGFNVDYIDILDFGVWFNEYGATYDANTPCGYAGPWHANANAYGQSDAGNYSYIANHFLALGENCCTMRGPVPQPRRSITVDELIAKGLDDMVALDVDRDGVFDMDDVRALLDGEEEEEEEQHDFDRVDRESIRGGVLRY